MMLPRVFIYFLLIKLGCAQIDGEFWWLNDKLASYIGGRPPSPKFENLSELDNDESARIIFRDEHLTNNLEATESNRLNEIIEDKAVSNAESQGHNIIKWPDEDKIFNGNIIFNSIPEQHLSEDVTASADIGDRLIFKFPENDNVFMWKDPFNTTTSRTLETEINPNNTSTSSTVLFNDKVSFNLYYEEKLSENICTYMKKSECYQSKGVLNNYMKDEKKQTSNQQLICCILPMVNENDDSSTKIYFPDTSKKIKRIKRSENVAQRQRNILLQRKSARPSNKARPTTQIKIANPDYEYDDPYWNIKNLKNPNKLKQESSTRFDYHTDDYIEDYEVELPRPGLTGLYSDNRKNPPGWIQNKGSAYGGVDEYDDDDDDVGGFGYSTIDPRIGSSTTTKSRPRGKPLKFTTASGEAAYNAESQTISYQSSPDFNVLQDFKLLNLMRNKNKVSKVTRSTTTESFSDNDSKESILTAPLDVSSEITSDDFEDRQIFKGCGKAAKSIISKNKSKQIGDTENGSHPWLALLVPTRKLNSVLCYASLIHPRAAISAADCVHRSSPGEITLLAGLWNLNERSRLKSRLISTLLHPNYKNVGLNNNLAILHWKNPLKLGVNVQPVCLANPHLDDECMFVGWGGFDQALRPKSRWQRASVHTCKDRLSLNGVNVPNEAFCASVQARSTVTGIGGSLVCNVNGHLSAVGVAVSRDSTLVLLPVHEWVTEAIAVLQE